MELRAHEEAETAGVGVTTGFLARKLGVSPTTLRSWDRRYGLGPAVRADGRHRRWAPDDVAMVQEMCRLTAAGLAPAEAARVAKEAARGPVTAAPLMVARALAGIRIPERSSMSAPRPGTPGSGQGTLGTPGSRSGTGLPLGDVRQECRGLARAAVRLDALAVQEQLTAAVRTHGLIRAWEDVMVPTLRAVGRKWESSGDRYVEVEHLLSWHVSATLRHVYVSAAKHGRDTVAPPVLLACLPGEMHTLPLEALNAALAERRVPVLTLGGAVPPEALMTAVQRVGPSSVVLWSQTRNTANLPLACHIAATRWGVRGARTRSQVLLSGPGWGRQSGPGLLRPGHLAEALRLIAAPENRSGEGDAGPGPATPNT
ncbi:MerR family transcriptional regulator [Streptomyces sp. NPDC060027]|uniref:MerR family transcriptional regulator n=1 Tax=Streptomyces sp. NPDC060027 TaxID=3347040 RepID=UPI0036AAE085